jgi:hypothetical protein
MSTRGVCTTLSKKPKLSFVDDPGKLYRQRRCATQAKVLETLDQSQSRWIIEISKGITTSKSKGRLLKRRMGKMEIEKEAHHLKAAKARSTCEECEEYDHVQGKP